MMNIHIGSSLPASRVVHLAHLTSVDKWLRESFLWTRILQSETGCESWDSADTILHLELASEGELKCWVLSC